MASSRTSGTQAAVLGAPDRDLSRRHRLVLAGMAGIALLLAGVVGWGLNNASRATHAVSVTSTFTGVVTVVNGGAHVSAAHELVHTGGNGYGILVIYPPKGLPGS